MLADDPDDAAEDAEEFLREQSLSAYYDEVAARALMLAQADVNRGVLDPLRQARIRDAIKGVIDNLSGPQGRRRAARGAAASLAAGQAGAVHRRARTAGRSRRPAAGGHAGQIWRGRRRWCRPTKPRPAQIDALDVSGVQLACVSYLEPGTYKNARYQVRRLRKRMPGVPVMALFWGLGDDHSRYLDSVEATECRCRHHRPQGNHPSRSDLRPPRRETGDGKGGGVNLLPLRIQRQAQTV